MLLYPFLGFAIAIGGAGLISPRCVAPVCCGCGLALGLLAARAFPRRRAATALVAFLLVWVIAREGFCASVLLEQRRAFLRLRDRTAEMPGQILVGDSSFALPLYFYSAPSIRDRMVFPIDFAAIHRFEKDDSGEQNLWAGRNGVFPFPIVPFEAVDLRSSSSVIARPDGWLADAVTRRRLRLRLDGQQAVYWSADWYRVGGVFTPMAHAETRILRATPADAP